MCRACYLSFGWLVLVLEDVSKLPWVVSQKPNQLYRALMSDSHIVYTSITERQKA